MFTVYVLVLLICWESVSMPQRSADRDRIAAAIGELSAEPRACFPAVNGPVQQDAATKGYRQPDTDQLKLH